jgi:hypothetical protein
MKTTELTIDQAEKLLRSWSDRLSGQLERMRVMGHMSDFVRDPALKAHAEKLRREMRSELPSLVQEVDGCYSVLAAAIQADAERVAS